MQPQQDTAYFSYVRFQFFISYFFLGFYCIDGDIQSFGNGFVVFSLHGQDKNILTFSCNTFLGFE